MKRLERAWESSRNIDFRFRVFQGEMWDSWEYIYWVICESVSRGEHKPVTRPQTGKTELKLYVWVGLDRLSGWHIEKTKMLNSAPPRALVWLKKQK
jgi:hypothetical protein